MYTNAHVLKYYFMTSLTRWLENEKVKNKLTNLTKWLVNFIFQSPPGFRNLKKFLFLNGLNLSPEPQR